MVEYAKTQGLKFVASNVPRRYANTVYHNGLEILDSLSPYAKIFMADLPLRIDTGIQIYQEMLQMVPDHSNANLVYSQGLKDATMAYFILMNKNSEEIFLHINGSYHSKNKQGILSFLKNFPLEKTLSIQTILKDKAEENDFSQADYTIVNL